jgi:iron complex outermembrane receptor protein
MARFRRLFTLGLLIALSTTALLAADGRITGRIARTDGSAIGGVIVEVVELRRATLTDSSGMFNFDGVPPGTYNLRFVAGEQIDTQSGVEVGSGQTQRIEKRVDWRLSVAETITVYSASRRTERIVEAPAAVTVVTEEEVEAIAPSGQATRLMETKPGVDYTASGLYDHNFNARGFNSSLNRRILTLIDGRDPSVPFLGSQEWAALSYPLDEMASVELVRGPGSALYGANAFSGVLNMTTKQPRLSEGGRLMLSGGDLNTRRADIRHAGGLGSEWYYRIVGGYQQSDDFSRSRRDSQEYISPDGRRPPREPVLLALDEVEVKFTGLRFDKHLLNGTVLTLEGGYAELEGPLFQTGIGRVQVTDVERPWARINYNMPHFNFLTYYDARKAVNQVALASGAGLYEDSNNLHGELQTNWDLFGGKALVIGGIAYNQQEVDTINPNTGLHTLMAEAKEEDQQSAFAQLELNPFDKLKLVAAARYDDSTLHDSEISPKAAIIYSITPNHTIRYGYNEAFQRPNYSELFLRAPAGAPVNLSAIENAFRPALGGVALGFSSIPILALGNSALEVEKVRSNEIGYAGIFGGKVYVTLDLYESKLSDFVTDLLPAVNPAFQRYQVPAGVNPAVAAQIQATLQANLPGPPAVAFPLFLAMTNLANGAPAFVISYTNAGKVDTQGAELAINYYLTNNWVLDGNYSYFDFDVKEQALGDVLLPNAPENKFNLGLAWRSQKFDAKISYRWVDEFPWAAGVFRGIVPQYDVVNLAATYRFTERLGFGVDVSNALDDEHYEAFGGDLMGRRALGYVSIGW